MRSTLRRRRGFTLIELLVVIAIIGLLSSVVLASLNTARSKGRDAAVQADLHTVQTQAELIRSGASCYTGNGACPTLGNAFSTAVCSSGPAHMCNDVVVAKALAAAQSAGGGLASFQEPAGGGAYAYAVQLASDKTKAWCVDSSGNAKVETIGGSQTQSDINAVITGYATCN